VASVADFFHKYQRRSAFFFPPLILSVDSSFFGFISRLPRRVHRLLFSFPPPAQKEASPRNQNPVPSSFLQDGLLFFPSSSVVLYPAVTPFFGRDDRSRTAGWLMIPEAFFPFPLHPSPSRSLFFRHVFPPKFSKPTNIFLPPLMDAPLFRSSRFLSAERVISLSP